MKITSGDLREDNSYKKDNEIGNLYKSIGKMNKAFTKMITGIDNTATMVLEASKKLNITSQMISERASEQAATTEEVASAMEQMFTIINSNTENAEITGQVSTKSASGMEESNEILVKTIKSVSEISEKIIIISEIADKTDILSINAAIEAARAGQEGRGFGVVAQEIRKLADKTKLASNEINMLSENGKKISKIAGEKLAKVIPELLKSTQLVKDIVMASREQKSGVESINVSVQQLTEITTENLISAEEMSDSSEELLLQAEQLKKLISVFKIDNL